MNAARRPSRGIISLATLIYLGCVGSFAAPPAVDALPSGMTVLPGSTHGVSATVNGNTMTINAGAENSNLQTIRTQWQSFDIGAQATVNINNVKPPRVIGIERDWNPAEKSDVFLVSVSGNSPTQIFGRLNAPGYNLVLLNQNGVVFGPGARVDAGGIIASSLAIDKFERYDDALYIEVNGELVPDPWGASGTGYRNSTQAFFALDFSGQSQALVRNEGVLSGRYVALVGLNVEQAGQVSVTRDAALVAGDAARLVINSLAHGDQEGKLSVTLRPGSRPLASIAQQGQIQAGENVFLMADVAEQVLQDAIAGQPAARQVVVRDGRLQLITVAGTVQAPSINSDVGANGQMEVAGRITAAQQMTHGGNLDVKASALLESPSISVKTAPGGTIDVAGTILGSPHASGIGGSIELLGDNVVIRNGALLDASGRSGGGSIQIGGSWQYPAGSLVRKTLSSVVEAGAVVRANTISGSHPPLTVVGSVVSGSATVTFADPTIIPYSDYTKGSTFVSSPTDPQNDWLLNLAVGMGVSGVGIPEGASIVSISPRRGFTLSVPATVTVVQEDLLAGGTAGFAVGMSLTGTNLPAGAIITGITSNTLTLSAVATGTGATTTVTGSGANTTGNGGTIVVTSDITNPASLTVARGRFEAKSGVKSGFGGHIETSGYSLDFKDGVYLNEGVRTFSGNPIVFLVGSVSGVYGGNGTWLIDRKADTVSPAEVSIIGATTGWSKVTLRHRSDVGRGVFGDIILASSMSFTEGGQFVAQAERDILLDVGLTGTGGKLGGYLKMSAERDIVFGSAGSLDSVASIVMLSAGRDLRIGDQSAAAASFTAGPTKLSAGRDIHLNVLANTFEPGFPGLYMAGSSFSTPGAATFIYEPVSGFLSTVWRGWGPLIDIFDVDNVGAWRSDSLGNMPGLTPSGRVGDAWRTNLIDANISAGGGAIHLYSNFTSSWFTAFKDRLHVRSDVTVFGLQNYFLGGLDLGANLNIANRSAGGVTIGSLEVFLKGINMFNGDIAVGSHVLTFGGAVAGLPQFAQAPTSLVLFGANTDYTITAAPNGRVNFDNVGLIQAGFATPSVIDQMGRNLVLTKGLLAVNSVVWDSLPKNVNRLVVEAGGISLTARGVHIDSRFVVTGDSDPALTLPTNLDLADAEGFRFGQMTVFDRGFEVVDGGSSTADLDVRIGRKVIFSPDVSGSQVRIAGDVTVTQGELAFLGRANIPVDVTLSGTSLTLTGSALHLGAAREADQGTYRLPAITADAASSIYLATRQPTYQLASANAIMGNVYVEDGLVQLPAGAVSFFGASPAIYVRQGSLDLNGNEIGNPIILDASNFTQTTSPKVMNDLGNSSSNFRDLWYDYTDRFRADYAVHYQEPGNPQSGNYGAVKQLFSSVAGADGYVNLPKLGVLGNVTLTMPAASPFLAFGELEVSTALTLGANASVAFTEQLAGLGANGIITVGSGVTTRILSSPTPSTAAGSFVLVTGATMEVGAPSLGAALQINNLGRLRLTAAGDIAAKDLVLGSGVVNIEVPAGVALSFSSIRSASASSLNPFYLEKSGPGLLKLSNPATPDVGFYGLRVLGGRVALMTANTLSPGSPAFATAQVSSGASLELNGHANDSPFFSVNGSGVSGEGALVSSSPSPLTIGALRLAGHATVDLGGATSILNIDSGLYNIINSSGGPVTLTKLGAGVLTLNPRATPPTDVAYDLKGGGLAVGRLFGAARVDVRAGAMLDLSFDDPTTAMQSYGFPLSIAGSGPNGDGAIVNYSTSASSGSPETGIAGYLSLGSLSLAGDAKIRSDNRVFYSGVISDGGSGFGLTLSGAAATSQHVFNSAAHTFSGGLNVQSAQVYLRNGNLGTGSIVLGDGAMVNLIGRSISSSVSVVAGAAATLANTSSTESVLSGSLSLAAGSVLSIGGGDTSIGNNLPLGKFSITGSVSGAGTLRKVGISNVKLNGDNALFAGQLSVQQGRITLGHGSALGTSQVSIANGGALDLNGFSTTTHFTLASVSGDYFSSYSQAAPLVNYSATPAIISGDIDLGADSAIFSSADLTFNGVIRTGPHTLQLKGTGARQLNNPANSISSLAVSGPSSVSVKSAGRDLVITGSFGSGGLSAELLTAHQLRLGAGLVSTSSSGNVLLRSSGSASIISAHNAGAFKVTVFADGDIDVVGNVTSRSVVLASPTGRISLTGTFSSHEENVYVMAAKPGNVTRTILVNTSNSAGLGSDRTVMYNTAVTTFDQLDSKVAAANAAVWHRSYTLSTPTTGKGRYGFAFIYSNSPYVTVTPIVLGKSADFRDQNGDGIGAQNELAYTGTATAEHAYASTNFGLIHWLRSPSGDGIDVLTSASLSLTGTPTITATDSNGNPVSLSNRTPEIRVFQSGIFQSSLTDVRIFPALQDAGVYHIAVGVGAMSASVPGVSVIAAPPLVYEIKPILLTGAYMANYGLTKTVGIAREYDGLSDVPAAYLNGAEALRTPAEMATTAGISDSTLFSGLDISLLSATFADASEGDNKPITVRYSLTQNGLASKNFVVPPLTSTAFVSNGQTYSTPLVGTIYTGNLLILSDLSLASRTYDGSVSGGISLASWGDLLSLRDGTRNPAGVTLDTTNVSLVYAAPDASMTQPVPVSVTGLALAGPNAASYRILNQSASGLILPKTVAITATKVYDGSKNMAGKVQVVTGVTVNGLAETLLYSGAMANSADVSTATHLASLNLLDGGNGGKASNYRLPVLSPATAPLTITPKQLTALDVADYGLVTGVTYEKSYDATVNLPVTYRSGSESLRPAAEIASRHGLSASLIVGQSGQPLDITLVSATYDTAAAGVGKPLTLTYATDNPNFSIAPISAAQSESISYGNPTLGSWGGGEAYVWSGSGKTVYYKTLNHTNSGQRGELTHSSAYGTTTYYPTNTSAPLYAHTYSSSWSSVPGQPPLTQTLTFNQLMAQLETSMGIELYNRSVTTSNFVGNIDPARLLFLGTYRLAPKTYDGTTAGSINQLESWTLAPMPGITWNDPQDAGTVQLATAGASLVYSDSAVARSGDGSVVARSATISGLQLTGINAANYFIDNQTVFGVINPLPITVRALAANKTYGDADPALGVALGAGVLAPTDTLHDVIRNLGRVPGETAGTYAIRTEVASFGPKSANYDLTYVGGDLTIARRALTVTALAAGKTYGDADPAFSAAVTAGSLGSATVADSLADVTGVLTRQAGEDVGAYGIALGAGARAANYDLTYVGGDLTIARRALTVTAAAAGKIYGDADPAFSAAVTGGSFAFADSLTDVTGVLTRQAGEDVGAYGIALGAGARASNYDLTYVGGNLTIVRRALGLSVQFFKQYGQVDPVLTPAIISGSLGSATVADSLADVTGVLTRQPGENAGVYGITLGAGVRASNYNITLVGPSPELRITPKPVIVRASGSKIYGETDPILTFSTNVPLIGTDSLSGALSRSPGETAGNYGFTVSNFSVNDGNGGANYNWQLVPGNFTIVRRALTVTALAAGKTYGDADPAFSAAVTGGSFAFADTLTDVVGPLTRPAGESVGSYALIPSGPGSKFANYDLTYVGGDLTIARRALTVTALAAGKTYGDADPAFSAAVTGGSFAFADSLADVTGVLTRQAGEDVGAYGIALGAGARASNYDLTYVGGDLTIARRALTVTAAAAGKTYGDADPAFSAAVTGGSFAFADSLADVTGVLTRQAGEDVGAYGIALGAGARAANYDLTYVGGDLTIARRALTVTALAAGKTYGDADPAFSAAVTAGSLGSATVADSLADVTGVLTRQAGENVGVYGIALGAGARAANYDLTYVGGDLTIARRALTVTALAAGKTYGDADPAFSAAVTAGSLGSATVADSLTDVTGVLTRQAGEDVGAYGIALGAGARAANYDLTYVGGDLTIARRALTVTAAAAGKIYGDADPAFSAAVTGGSFAFADTLTDVVGPLTRPAGESVGSYALIPSGPGSKFANYDLTYVGGDLTIARRALTVTALAAGKTYGDADPAFSAAVTGGSFAFADSLADVTGVLTRQAGEDVGAYGIALGAGARASNYDLTYVGGDLTIARRALTVTAAAAGKTYGDADPAFSAAVTGGSFAFADSLADVTGVLTRQAGEDVGAYGIALGAGARAANYDLTYVGGDLTIARRALTVTALAAGKTYGDADPAFSAAVTAGSLGSATVADSLADVTGVLTRQAGENVGAYGIALGAGARAANYDLTYVGGDLTIARRALTVTALAAGKTYGDADPAFSAAVTAGSLGSATVADSLADVTGVLTRQAGEDVGAYGIALGAGARAANYDLTYVGGDLTIARRALTVTAAAAGKIYGDADPAFSAAVTGGSFAFADSLTDVTGVLTRQAGEDVGAYGIALGAGARASNYDLTYVGGDLTIARRALTVTAAAAGKTYGDADPAFSAAVTGGSFAFADSLTDVTGVLTRQAGEDVGAYGIALGAGARAFNYDLTYVGGDLTVTPKSLRVVGLSVNNKVYDGTTSASLSNSGAILGNASNSGDGRFFAGDDVTLTVSSAGLALPSKNVGTYVLGNLPGLLLSGSSARNYRLDPISGTAVITPRPIVISGISASDKVYDASERAVVSVTNASGWIQGDDLRVSVTGAFTDKNVGPGKSVTLSSVYSGADAANYIITDQLTATASIRVKPLRVFGFGVQSKNADGTDTATITGTPVLQGGAVSDGDSRFYDNDAVSIAGSAVGRFASTAPSPSIPVEVSGLSLQGLDAANYSLMTVSATGSITSNQEFRPRFEQVSFPVQAAYVSPGIPQATVTVVMDSGLVSDLMPETPSRLILDPGLMNSLTPVLILNTDSSFGAISLPTKPLALPGQPFSLSLASVLGVPSVPEGLRVVLTTPDGNVPAWANFELDGGMLRGIAPASEASPSLLRVTATDRQSNVASFTLVAGAAAVGSPPKPSGFVAVNGVKPQVVTVGTLLSFKVPEGTFKHENSSEPLQFTATRADGSPLPSWMSFDPASQTFSGEPPAGEQGVLDVVVIATDSGQNKAQVQMKITVK